MLLTAECWHTCGLSTPIGWGPSGTRTPFCGCFSCAAPGNPTGPPRFLGAVSCRRVRVLFLLPALRQPFPDAIRPRLASPRRCPLSESDRSSRPLATASAREVTAATSAPRGRVACFAEFCTVLRHCWIACCWWVHARLAWRWQAKKMRLLRDRERGWATNWSSWESCQIRTTSSLLFHTYGLDSSFGPDYLLRHAARLC